MPRLFVRLFAAAAVLASVIGVVTASPAGAAPATFHIEGGGFGHGVGASQYGMLGYAQQGWAANDILGHYFTGTSVQPLPQPSEVRVWLAEDTTAPMQANFTPTGNVNLVMSGQVQTSAASGQVIRVDVVSGKFNVFVNGEPRLNQIGGGGTNLYVQYNEAPISLDKTGRQYKWGQIELSAVNNTLRIVLTSETMQQYLYGLGEVPSSWPAEALKAQAIAARTYALEKVNRLGQNRAECGCALWTDVRDQNYIGYDKETGSGGTNWVNAVNATDGQVSTYQGAAIQAFYSSSSGGHTENSENVFVQALPYLKGVPDPYDGANGLNSLHSWKRDWSLADMQSWVNSNPATAVGTLQSIEFLAPLGVSGRVTKVIDPTHGGVRITGSDGTKRVNGTTFQSVINAAPGSGSNPLPSTLMRLGGATPYGAFPGGVFVAAGKLTDSDVNRIVTGADKGGGPHVRVLDTNGDGTGVEFMAYDQKFGGGVRVAVCRLGDDALASIITAPGAGGGPHVRVFSAAGAAAGGGFMAYAPNFTGGIYVGCGDVDPTNPGDEIITGPGAGGGPHVRVFDRDGNVRGEFMAYDAKFTGGVRVAGGTGLVATAPGPGGGPHVRLFNLIGGELGGFMAYAPTFTGGVYVAAGNVMGDGSPEVVTGAGDPGGPHVRVFGTGGNELTGFMAFQTTSDHGARVAAARVPGGAVVAGSGTGGPSLLRVIAVS